MDQLLPGVSNISIANDSNGNIIITNARLPFADKAESSKTWAIEIHAGRVVKVSSSNDDDDDAVGTPESRDPSTCTAVDAQGGLVLPSDFREAMQVTKAAKSEFPKRLEDLHARGARIIEESVEHGVTAIRAHVEIDTSVGFACLEAALTLQREYRAHCDVQIAIFAQEPLFDSGGSVDHRKPGRNFELLEEASLRHGVSVVGSAPYVEPSIAQAKMNVGLIFDIADARGIDHVDFHLDYNLDPESEPLIYEVIAQAKKRYQTTPRGDPDGSQQAMVSSSRSSIDAEDAADAPISHTTSPSKRPCPRITIGHATRLQLFSPEQWRALIDAISDLPIVFVGLPQSDMYMQGRSFWDAPLGAPRGTLRVPYLHEKYGIEIAMSVNNVENAFTPQGSLDPLSLCTFGVGVFQAATPAAIRSLVRSVTLTSKRAMGLDLPYLNPTPRDLTPSIGDTADFVILHKRASLQSAVLNPPFERTTIKAGRVVACKRGAAWLAPR
ncbi:hypothetical protein JR316_0006895 [Psilocybe cubensis]|uniref:Uncharacterized protein n=2 Tax=Psilocybe cubensis TaxID=181762 RepID=A0A8H8CML5_PSICU|nr:hypothetical protein JR316_0006895 [Psilocybe cubensis]KAH9480297.1 hypothetical protein JR316_0006895 [Psilocybe cubensis]